MEAKLGEIETELIARQMRRTEEAKQILDREPGRVWSTVVSVLPILLSGLFPKQISNLVGLPPSAAWFVAFTLGYAIYTSWEITILRKQFKALRLLSKRDA